MLKNKDYPKTVVVKNSIYHIKFVRKLKKDTVAECDPSDLIIRILKKQTPKETLKCFIHELLHAVEFEYNLKIKHSLIRKLEKPFFNLLKDNYLL